MTKKGNRTTQKRISAPPIQKIQRKRKVFVVAMKPGTHPKQESVSLGVVLRDLLNVAGNMREAKAICRNGDVLVDGKQRKSVQFGIGLFDIVEFPKSAQKYKMVLDKQGRLVGEEEKAKGNVKLCKIVAKKTVKGGKILLSANDGSQYVQDKTKANVGDSLKVEVPAHKIVEILPLEKGAHTLLTGGQHKGEYAQIVDIVLGSFRKPSLLTLKLNGKDFQTTKDNAFVVDEKSVKA